MNSPQKTNDLFTRFVNWFSNAGNDKPVTEIDEESRDFFSRFMNRISG